MVIDIKNVQNFGMQYRNMVGIILNILLSKIIYL
nr:MAG TPA: hypothetical protein [Caudoviricetes sp.]